MRTVGQVGGLPKHTLSQPSALVRGHLLWLRTKGHSGGVLFLDCKDAYYSVVRDLLVRDPKCQWDPARLQERAQLLFVHRQDQLTFIEEMTAGNWSRALALPLELQRLLAAHLRHTWFADGNPGTTLYETASGSAPGAPVADTIFAFLFSRFLRDLQEEMRVLGLSPHLVQNIPPDSCAEAPTWADDVAILFCAPDAKQASQALSCIGKMAIFGLSSLGLEANLGPGKTEAIISLRGAGSKSAKQDMLCQAVPTVHVCARGYASGSYWAQTIFPLLAKNLERLRFETLFRETCYHAFSRHTTTAQSDMLYKCSVKRSHAP